MKKLTLPLSILLFFSFTSADQEVSGDEVIEKITTFYESYPQEKAYVHMDKPFYSTGETIWFKTYLVDAVANVPSGISEVVYVDLLDEEKRVLATRKLKVKGGGAAGDFKLSDSLDPGEYSLRAYTNWMRNFDSEFFYRKSFKILKTYISDSISSPPVTVEDVSMAFFPEGGDLIAGLPSIVGFKAVNNEGKGIDITAQLFENGESILSLESERVGIGKFIFTPKPETYYSVKLNYKGRNYAFALPKAEEAGCAMRVLNGFESDKVAISINSKGLDLNGGYIIGHHNGNVFAKIENSGTSDDFGTRIEKSLFPSGICHLTFFTKDGVPQAERLVVVNQEIPMNVLKTEKSKETYERRSLTVLKVSLADSIGSAMESNLSVSITPRNLVSHEDNSENIRNYLLLSSELKGRIEEPDYYFQNGRESYEALDNLMLTQGWRRFNWKEVLQNGKRLSYPNEKGISVSGRLVDSGDGKRPREGKLSVSTLGSNLDFYELETDETGSFFFSELEFYDSTTIHLQAQRKVGKKGKYDDFVAIKIHPTGQPAVHNHLYNELFKTFEQEPIVTYLEEKKRIEKIDRAFNFDSTAILLDEVKIFSRDESPDPYKRVGMIYSEPSARIKMDSILTTTTALSVFDVMKGRVAGVVVGGNFPTYVVQIRGVSSIGGNNNPLFLLNGVYSDINAIAALNPNDILFIDILKGSKGTIYGSRGYNGVFAVYTREKDTPAPSKKPGMRQITVPGFHQARTFYTPIYDTPKAEHAKPDIRSTLYWNPNVYTNYINGEATFSFYTSDQMGDFDVRIEGIGSNGDPVFHETQITVQ